jgi:hypothetical protein
LAPRVCKQDREAEIRRRLEDGEGRYSDLQSTRLRRIQLKCGCPPTFSRLHARCVGESNACDPNNIGDDVPRRE